MLEEVRKDGGVSLPTVGSEGLIEYVRVQEADRRTIQNLGSGKAPAQKTAAVVAAAKKGTAHTAMAARFRLQEQEGDPFGGLGGAEIEEDASPFGNSDDQPEVTFGEQPAMEEKPAMEDESSEDVGSLLESPQDTPLEQIEVAPGQEQPGVVFESPAIVEPTPGIVFESQPRFGFGQPTISQMLTEPERADVREQIITVEERDRIINEKVRKQVQFEIERSMQELKSNPSDAIERIKNMLEVVAQTPELSENTNSELRNRLESALLSATREKLEFDQREEIASINIAIADSIRNETLAYERREEKLARLIGQYNTLMKERNYAIAEEVADTIEEAYPQSPEAVLTTTKARIAHAHFELEKIRREKERLFTTAVRQIYSASYPILSLIHI